MAPAATRVPPRLSPEAPETLLTRRFLRVRKSVDVRGTDHAFGQIAKSWGIDGPGISQNLFHNRGLCRDQQRDWLLNTLLQDTTPGLDDIPLKDLQQNAPDWKTIVQDLQRETNRYLTDDGILYDRGKIQKLYRTINFPYKDLEFPGRHIVPMASGSAVRSDNPFEDVRTPVRGTIAIDMEGATFYRTTVEFPGIRSLLVKGVSDYADLEKDDSYHAYAAAVSSAYILCFIKEYVSSERIPVGE